MFTFLRCAGLACAAALAAGDPAVAAAPPPGHRIAYVRAGSIYLFDGTGEHRLTRDSDDARPRWSPDGRRIAYLHAGRLWMIGSDGTGMRALTSGPAGGPAWSPDGRYVAFAAPACTGTDGVFEVDTIPDRHLGRTDQAAFSRYASRARLTPDDPHPGRTGRTGQAALSATPGSPRPLFPVECRTSAPGTGAVTDATLADRLRTDSAVAWSPDGTRIAFRGGRCLGIFDDCLSVGDVAAGVEQVIAGYGGGGMEFSGFAVLPAWRPDGQRLSWTAEQDGDSPATHQPVHVVEADPTGHGSRTVGGPGDREMVYDGSDRGVLTGRYRDASWVIAVDLITGTRTPLRPGSQPSVAPAG